MSQSVPAGKKILAIFIMVLMTYLYYHYSVKASPQIKLNKVQVNDVVSVTLIKANKTSEQIVDPKKIANLINMYNLAKVEKDYKIMNNPAILIYIEMKNADIYIASYNKEKVIIQYKSANINKQYLAKSTTLVKYLKNIKSP